MTMSDKETTPEPSEQPGEAMPKPSEHPVHAACEDIASRRGSLASWASSYS